jgi:hypothetical protein
MWVYPEFELCNLAFFTSILNFFLVFFLIVLASSYYF